VLVNIREIRKVARLEYDPFHGKLWQDIKADLDKTKARASKFANDAEWAFGERTVRVLAAVGSLGLWSRSWLCS